MWPPTENLDWEFVLIRSIGFAVSLFVLWLMLSGFFSGLLLTLGVASSLLVVLIAHRMDVVDHEGYPVHLNLSRLIRYGVWLALQVIKSNVDVCRRIWTWPLAISPAVVRVHSSQKSKLGQVILANSITLTPGTVSINLWRNEIRVHALTRESAAELQAGEMDSRVSALEGR